MKLNRAFKRLAFACGVVAHLLVGNPAFAAEGVSASASTPETPNLLIFDPGALINGVVRFEYERAINTWFGISLGLAVTTFRGAFSPDSERAVIAVGPELGVKFHFIQDAPGGLWIGPYVGGSIVANREGGSTASAFAYDLGAALGYNLILFKHFVLSLGVGGGFHDRGYGIAWAPRFRLGLGGVF